MEGQSKKVVYELLIAFVAILLLVVLRPMFVGQIAGAGTPYSITYQNGTTTSTQTVTPSSAMSVTQADTIYSIVIYLVALIALVVIILTVAGRI